MYIVSPGRTLVFLWDMEKNLTAISGSRYRRGSFYWPAMPEPDNQDLRSNPYPTEEFLTDWLLRTCEIIDEYRPSLLYFDWWLQHEAFKEVLKKLGSLLL